LASAYAKKAGISIRELARTVDLTQKISNLKGIDSKPVNFSETDAALNAVSNLLLLQVKFIESIRALPFVTEPNLFLIDQAIRNIDQIEDNTPADLIYLAILKAIYSRSLFERVESANSDSFFTQRNGACTIQVNQLRTLLLEVSKPLAGAVEDLIKALPEKKSQLEETKLKIETLRVDITKLKDVSVVASEIDSTSIKQIYSFIGRDIPDVCNN
jgi:hypothetical protein